MAAGEAIRLDYQDLAAILHETPQRVGPTLGAALEQDAMLQPAFDADIPMMAASHAFDPFQARSPEEDPEVSGAFKRLDLVEARLARIEKRLMEISLLIARNFNATLETPLGVPDVLELSAQSPTGSAQPSSSVKSTGAQTSAVPRQTRGRRDRDLDDALEAFLNSLGPTQTRQ